MKEGTEKVLNQHDQCMIEMEEISMFNLTDDELRRFYITFALVHYTHLRHPDYNQEGALSQLSEDFKRFTTMAGKLLEQDPNNLMLYKFRRFFERHHKLLLECK
ncbi:MAG: hypothetical protein R3Y22_04375 [Bacteroidales bacterium]